MSPIIEFVDVSVVRDGREIVRNLDWTVSEGEHWVVLGPNGAGKTTVIQLASALIHPSRGMVGLFGEVLGLVDVFELKPRIGISSAAMYDRFDEDATVFDIVRTAAFGMTGTWREEYESLDDNRARNLLAEWGLEEFAYRRFATLSEGERKRVLIARARMTDPEMLLLDEPAAGLDIAARERLVSQLDALVADPDSPVTVLVTHHVEEIPASATHVLMLNNGQTIAKGPISDVLTDLNVSRTFGVELQLLARDTAHGRRWTALVS